MTTTQSDPAALAAEDSPEQIAKRMRTGYGNVSILAGAYLDLLRPAQGQGDGQSGVEERMLLRKWASLSKGLGLTQRSGNVADFDDELASLLVEAATATLKWREDEFLTAPPPSAPAQGSHDTTQDYFDSLHADAMATKSASATPPPSAGMVERAREWLKANVMFGGCEYGSDAAAKSLAALLSQSSAGGWKPMADLEPNASFRMRERMLHSPHFLAELIRHDRRCADVIVERQYNGETGTRYLVIDSPPPTPEDT